MTPFSLRICATFLLMLALLCLSGITATAEALTKAGEAASCCDHDEERGQQPEESAPCSVPDCPCAFCLTIDLADRPTICRNVAGASSPFPHQQLYPPQEFTSSIDYPPESV